MWGLGYLRFRVRGVRLGDLGSRAWGLGFCIWGLSFGAEGSGGSDLVSRVAFKDLPGREDVLGFNPKAQNHQP